MFWLLLRFSLVCSCHQFWSILSHYFFKYFFFLPSLHHFSFEDSDYMYISQLEVVPQITCSFLLQFFSAFHIDYFLLLSLQIHESVTNHIHCILHLQKFDWVFLYLLFLHLIFEHMEYSHNNGFKALICKI